MISSTNTYGWTDIPGTNCGVDRIWMKTNKLAIIKLAFNDSY